MHKTRTDIDHGYKRNLATYICIFATSQNCNSTVCDVCERARQASIRSSGYLQLWQVFVQIQRKRASQPTKFITVANCGKVIPVCLGFNLRVDGCSVETSGRKTTKTSSYLGLSGCPFLDSQSINMLTLV